MKAGAAAFLAALAVYWRTAAPGLGHGHDTGELTTVALTLGVAHPPGYPLYTQLGHWWARLFAVGDPAWRLNLFSGLCLALAAGLLAAAVARNTRSQLAGWVAGTLFAFAQSVWRQAVAAEVFALHLLLLSVLVWLAVGWEASQRRQRYANAAALALGLGLAHHHTIALALPGLFVFGWLGSGGRKWGLTPAVLVLVLLGSVPFYVDLMYRARERPAINWGEPVDAQRLGEHFLRKSYGTFKLSARPRVPEGIEAHLTGYAITLVRHQLPLPLILLSVLGIAAAGRKPLGALFLTWAFVMGPVFIVLGSQAPDDFRLDLQERFYASSVLALAGLAGLGTAWLQARWPRPSLLLALAPLLSLGLNWGKCSQAGEYLMEDTMRATFAACPRDAVLVVTGDLPTGAAEYLQLVKGVRPDVTLLMPGLMAADWYASRLPGPLWQAAQTEKGHDARLLAVLKAHRQRGKAVYFNRQTNNPGHFRSRGLLWEWWPEVIKLDPLQERAILQASLQHMLASPPRGSQRLSGDQTFWLRFTLSFWATAYRALSVRLYEHKDLAGSTQALDRALALVPPRPVDLLNRGLLAFDERRYDEAERFYQEALQLQPGYDLALAALEDLRRARRPAPPAASSPSP